MRTLIIHPKDSTTDFLIDIYADKGWDLINTEPSNKKLKEDIKSHDRIVMLGHGTKHGLIGFNKLIISSKLVYLLREKECVFVWCNANEFVEKYKLKGFYTGMFISEDIEANMFNVKTNQQFINQSNEDFATALKNSINKENILESVNLMYENTNELTKFNKDRFYAN
jgi:hypothetical protein